jgi:hypothetical protein
MKVTDRHSSMVERKTLVVLFAGLTVAGMLAVTMFVEEGEALRVALGDIENVRPGSLVDLQGTVVEVSSPKSGRYAIVDLEDEVGDRVQLFLEFSPDGLTPGDRVRVRGTVAIYEGQAEVVVEGSKDLDIIEEGRRGDLALADLMEAPWNFVDEEISLTVTLESRPVRGIDGSSWGFVVSDPRSAADALAMASVPSIQVASLPDIGDEVTLVAMVVYDTSAGVVYLLVSEFL